ncbi:acyltransferase family protein [Pseudomonas sp. C5pp]|uniref:acyltransferase family protein n=1 Tax=Pseudomonas sp. C5pp TaxID=1586081 RepID=UPI00068B339D|nr:acyltransferase family protein [Pseudomonas sp. C5pp]
MTSLSHADLAGATSIHNAQSYRPDIDGLRAIAVLAVILYHFKVPFFHGGFVGVDVFFVISGYLITKGILSQQGKGRFDFGDFYTRRVRRLIPALLATIAASFIAAAFLFSPEDFKQMSGSTVYALAGISNLFFWMQSGYFDSASTVKPLLHTWSLSVEIQFYILWPLILVGVTKLTKNVLAATTLIFVIGAAAAYFFLQQDASGAFFLTPFRIHEFLVGALVVLVERNKVNAALKELAYLAGLALVIAPIFLYSSNGTLFPGLAALVPVAGAALMIFAGGSAKAAWPCRSWAATKIGEVSYSLYLVHWPLFVFASYFLMRELTALETTALAGMTFIAAIALYSLIEKPLRKAKGAKLSGNGFALASLGCSTALIVVASSGWGQNGWEWRVPAEIAEIAKIDINAERAYVWQRHNLLNKKDRFDEGNSNPKLLIIGDSQAGDLINILDKSGISNSYNIVSRVVGSDCGTPLIDETKINEFFRETNPFSAKNPTVTQKCTAMLHRANDEHLISSADKVFIAMRWRDFGENEYTSAITNAIKQYKAKFYIFGRKDISKGSIEIATKFGRIHGIENYAARFKTNDAAMLNLRLKEIDGSNFVDLLSITCPEKNKCIVISAEGKPIFFDQEHLTRFGVSEFSKIIPSML